MSSFFRGLESITGAILIVVVVAVGVFLVWVWFSGFVGRGVSSVEVPVEVVKIEGGYVTNVGGGVVVFVWLFNAGGGWCCRVLSMSTELALVMLCALQTVFRGL